MKILNDLDMLILTAKSIRTSIITIQLSSREPSTHSSLRSQYDSISKDAVTELHKSGKVTLTFSSACEALSIWTKLLASRETYLNSSRGPVITFVNASGMVRICAANRIVRDDTQTEAVAA